MNWLRIGTIAFCTLAAVAGIATFQRNSPIDEPNRAAPAVVTLAAPVDASPAREFLPESDTTGLLQESRTIEELLNEIDADSGGDFTPVDRERLAVELREALGD